MKLRLLSDLHLEHAPMRVDWRGEDVLVIAGDISPGIFRAVALIDAYLESAPNTTRVVVVCGNHDFYGASVSQGLETWRGLARERVHHLEDESVVIDGVRFWGATMWTDLARLDPSTVKACLWGLTDFAAILQFSPAEFCARHRTSKNALERTLDSSPEPVVVVTHHLPTVRSQHAKYDGDPIGPAFYSTDLDHLVGRPLMWLHGHTHSSVDYRHGETRVLCNPRGVVRMFRKHVKKRENPDFQEELMIDV